jgi:hypothetical protein
MSNPVSDQVTVSIDYAGYEPTPAYQWDGPRFGQRDPALIAALEAELSEEAPGLTFTVVSDHGPGGGWPEVEVSGPRQYVRDWLVGFWEGDEESVQELYGL